MAMFKQKKYVWKDTNVAEFGTDKDRYAKKESAGHDAAWRNAGLKPGLQIWRIVTYKKAEKDQLLYDIHFWIGKYSTQDEYGTAAYKTVELDTFLDDKPVQHREVQGHESELFKSYFKAITILHGGAESGFKHIKPEEYKPRLLHFHGDRKGVTVREIPRCRNNLDNTDVYILDMGLKLIQWNGSGSNKEERVKAMFYLKELQAERGGKCKTETLDEDPYVKRNEFYKNIPDDESMVEEQEDTDVIDRTKELYRLSDVTGDMKMTLEKTGEVEMDDFDSNDVFIFDTKDSVFVWIGMQTTRTERQNAMSYAHNYLMKTDHPLVPISCLSENSTSKAFQMALAA
ncbi:hypothetical protein ACF0H5_014716 [Mactra antiquata]